MNLCISHRYYSLTDVNGIIELVMQDENATYWLVYCLIRVYKRYLRTTARHRFLHKSSPCCALCQKYLPYSKRTIDHIIPQELCYELEWPLLVYDERNFQVMCHRCNNKKGDNYVEYLPGKVLEVIRKRREELMQRDSSEPIALNKLEISQCQADISAVNKVASLV